MISGDRNEEIFLTWLVHQKQHPRTRAPKTDPGQGRPGSSAGRKICQTFSVGTPQLVLAKMDPVVLGMAAMQPSRSTSIDQSILDRAVAWNDEDYKFVFTIGMTVMTFILQLRNDTARLHVIRQDSRRTYDKINFIYKLSIGACIQRAQDHMRVPSVERPIQPYPGNKNIFPWKEYPVVNISGGTLPLLPLIPS